MNGSLVWASSKSAFLWFNVTKCSYGSFFLIHNDHISFRIKMEVFEFFWEQNFTFGAHVLGMSSHFFYLWHVIYWVINVNILSANFPYLIIQKSIIYRLCVYAYKLCIYSGIPTHPIVHIKYMGEEISWNFAKHGVILYLSIFNYS